MGTESGEYTTKSGSDASWRENSTHTGLGWTIIRDNNPMLFSRVEPHVSSPLMAEGIAMREAIRKCKEMGLRKIRCEADSKQLITYINNKAPVPEFYGIISDILALAAEF
uniref:RNase H type-1 domain-containing protein n=1 Tax=Brassica oleracea TaxID=3712 RepID=A0A3P6GJF8_BRAOL|nr:unnamed protein product [Brassica oleracea]